MMKLKGCSRCGGDLYIAWDIAVGWFSACFQCGQDYYPRRLVLSGASPARKRDYIIVEDRQALPA